MCERGKGTKVVRNGSRLELEPLKALFLKNYKPGVLKI
jgi:hypothetical protein